ncbi:hypothetical protein KJ830_04405 [bacterium]|nr:hypothetical protein [bacterium]MBU4510273.1 hypothetical protein [bacterium]
MTYAIITIIIVLIIIFYWLILPLFKYLSSASKDIRDDVLPGLLDLDKTIITICSAAIILTINIIDKSVIGENYLITSWFSLITCIGIGILILLTSYVERVAGGVFVKTFSDLSKESKNMVNNKYDTEEKKVKKTLNHWRLLNKILVVLIYLLVSSLFISFLFMIIFGLKNL